MPNYYFNRTIYIIPSTYIFSIEKVRYQMLYRKLEASTFSDSRDSLKSIKITRRKMKTGSDTCQIQNLDFVSYIPGPDAGRGQARTPTQLTLHRGASRRLKSRQTDVFDMGFLRTQFHQESRGPSNSDLRNMCFQYGTCEARI